MTHHVMVVLLAAVFAGGQAPAPPEPPEFPAAPAYTVSGTIMMHGLEGGVDFTAHHDAKLGGSQIDYLSRTRKALQLASKLNKQDITPEETIASVGELCLIFEIMEQKPQGVFPNLTNFKFVRTEPCETGTSGEKPCENHAGQPLSGVECAPLCHIYEKIVERNGGGSRTERKHIFSLRCGPDGTTLPARYNTTEFEIKHSNYVPNRVSNGSFGVETAEGTVCTVVSQGPGLGVSRVVNPMRKLVHPDTASEDGHDSTSGSGLGKRYDNARKYSEHHHNHTRNVRFVKSRSRRDPLWTDERNDRAHSRRGNFNSDFFSDSAQNEETQYVVKPYPRKKLDRLSVPDEIDWRELGAVTPVMDQGECGSCWAIAAAGQIEGEYSRHHNLVKFSAQEILDCSNFKSNRACGGGFSDLAFLDVMEHGLSTEAQYPYQAMNGTCRNIDRHDKPVRTIRAIYSISGEEHLRKIVGSRGPIVVYLQLPWCSFYEYPGGIYEGSWWDFPCFRSEEHAVLVVGYGTADGSPYWLIKNSHGEKWGEGGYMRMLRGKNLFGIADEAYVVHL